MEAKSRLDSLNNNNGLLKKIKELNQELGNFDINVPSEDNLSILLIDLEKFAESFNVKVLSLNSKPETEKELIDPKKKSKSTKPVRKKKTLSPLYSIPLEISAIGYYQDILNFIDTLENYERKVIIDSIRVENYKEDKFTSNPRVEITINCEIYRFNNQNIELTENKDQDNKDDNKDNKTN
jgi:Tfp pilus assembly protein PilO